MSQLKLYVLSLIVFLISSCNTEDPLSNSYSNTTDVNDPAFSLIEAFAMKVDGKNSEPVKLKFKEKQIKKYCISDYQIIDNSLSRYSNCEDISISTILFDNEGTPGFAIVGESELMTKLYFYTSNGTPETIREIIPAALIIDSIPYYFVSDIAAKSEIGAPIKPGIYPPIDSIAGWHIIGPITNTHWGQGSPYNSMTPVCEDTECNRHNQHMPIGCGAVALGQFFAQQGMYISSNGIHYDLKEIGSKAKPEPDEELIVADVLYDISTKLNTIYGCYGSSSYMTDFFPILFKNGYTLSYNNRPIDNSKLSNNLRLGFPHIIRGIDNNGHGGHFWLIDGIYGPLDNPYYHCNWGFDGRGNCWTTANPFKPTNLDYAFLNGIYHIYIDSHDI